MGRNRASAGRTSIGGQYPPPMDNWGAIGAFQENFSDWGMGLSVEQRTALKHYCGFGYVDINQALRDGTNPSAMTGAIDAALSTAIVPENVTAIRYMPGGVLEGHRVGAVFRDAAFVSTSLRSDLSWGGHRCEIRVPKGYHAATLQGISGVSSEAELLLSRGVRFRVVSIGTGTRDNPTVLQVLPKK